MKVIEHRAHAPGHAALLLEGSRVLLASDIADRADVRALQLGADPVDRRVGPEATYGTDWLPEAHEHNVRLSRLRPFGRSADRLR